MLFQGDPGGSCGFVMRKDRAGKHPDACAHCRPGIAVRRYEMLEPTLENLFMEVLGNETQLFAFGKKEWMELVRSGKFLVLLILFCLFGIMNPAVAKLRPDDAGHVRKPCRGGISGRPRNGGRDDLLDAVL